MTPLPSPQPRLVLLLYHFCRLQLPGVQLGREAFERHLRRTFALYQVKELAVTWDAYLENLYPTDWYVASACLDGNSQAWEALFAARTGRSDCLLIDALRARAVRLYPRDEERQDNAVTEFWSHLIISETDGSLPVLARYDGQRPLVPWLIRVFQNWHISQLRGQGGMQALPDDDLSLPLPPPTADRWHDVFAESARAWLQELADNDLLLLGLRWRYRMSQREVAQLLGVHEGTISRQTTNLRDRCLESVTEQLRAAGWLGEDLMELLQNEMPAVLTDEPRLSADHLATLLAERQRQGKKEKKRPADESAANR
ncbi:MAG: sigma-70 family RNA polymerase sigma factor [Gemmataceae bacterium]